MINPLPVCHGCNVCFFSFPQALPPTTATLSIYCTSVTVFFIVIKMVNYRLHLMFDRGDIVAQNSVPDISKGVDKKSNASDSCLPSLR